MWRLGALGLYCPYGLGLPEEGNVSLQIVYHRSWGDLAHESELRTGAGSTKLSSPHGCCRQHHPNVGNVFLIEKGLSHKERHGEPCWADEKLTSYCLLVCSVQINLTHCLSLCGPQAKIGVYKSK